MSSRQVLSLLSNDGEEEKDANHNNVNLNVNQEFARRYEYNKKREDLHRMKEIEANVGEDEESDDEDDEDEDEAGELPVEIETRIFDTLAKIKKKDPSIYDSSVKFFPDELEADGNDTTEDGLKSGDRKQKKIFLKDMGLANAEAAEDGDLDGVSGSKVKNYNEEQEEIRKAFLRAAESAAEDDDAGLLKLRKKKKDKKVGSESNDAKTAAEKYFEENEKLNEGDLFLKDYILNQGWLNKEQPWGGEGEQEADVENIVEEIEMDEDALELQDNFEASYNFRFEEGASSQVEAHLRKVEGSVRKKSEKRREIRQSRLARKQEEEAMKREELKRLKNVKKQEIERQLQELRQRAGGDLEGLDLTDLDAEFDPEEYDKKMNEVFGKEYYEAEDAEMDTIDEDEGEVAAMDEVEEEEGGAGGEETAEGFRKARQRVKEGLDEEDKQFLEKCLDEYYKLDYEDRIGDLPTRFKYREVQTNNFGLSSGEILAMDDKELNQIVSVKKLAPYRTQEWKVMGNGSHGGEDAGKKRQRVDNGKTWQPGAGSKGEGGKGDVQVPVELVTAQGLGKSAKKNLKRKLKKMASRGEEIESLPLSRLNTYGVGVAGPTSRKKELKK